MLGRIVHLYVEPEAARVTVTFETVAAVQAEPDADPPVEAQAAQTEQAATDLSWLSFFVSVWGSTVDFETDGAGTLTGLHLG